MQKFKIILILIVSGIVFHSCLKDREAERRAEEMRILEQYIQNNGITVSPTKSGLYYIELVEGTGYSPVPANWIEFSYTARLVSNPDVVVMTSDSLTAQENSLYNSAVLYGPKRLKMSTLLLNGLAEGIGLMKEGGKARLIFPSTLGYGSLSFGNVPAYSSFIMDIELVHVIPDIVHFERTLMNNYLLANNITDDSTSSGLIYHEIIQGTGDFPTDGKTVTMIYKGTFLDGKVFTKSDVERSFIMGQSELIKGVEEGIRLMKKGGKAKIIVPYYLAYGVDGYVAQINNEVVTLIWPYTTLVYDIELTNIQ